MSNLDEQIATALVAKMAGMTLKEVDESTVKPSSSGPATKLDPRNFISGYQEQQQNVQQQSLEYANKMAEMLYPLPSVTSPAQALPGAPAISSVSQPQTTTSHDPNQLTFDFINDTSTQNAITKQLDSIVNYLYAINQKLEKLTNKRG